MIALKYWVDYVSYIKWFGSRVSVRFVEIVRRPSWVWRGQRQPLTDKVSTEVWARDRYISEAYTCQWNVLKSKLVAFWTSSIHRAAITTRALFKVCSIHSATIATRRFSKNACLEELGECSSSGFSFDFRTADRWAFIVRGEKLATTRAMLLLINQWPLRQTEASVDISR